MAHGWEQHALKADGTLCDASEMEWGEDEDEPSLHIGKPSSF